MSRNLATLIAKALMPKQEEVVAAPMVPPQAPPFDPALLYGDAAVGATPQPQGQQLNPQLEALRKHSGLLNLLYNLRANTAGQIEGIDQQPG